MCDAGLNAVVENVSHWLDDDMDTRALSYYEHACTTSVDNKIDASGHITIVDETCE